MFGLGAMAIGGIASSISFPRDIEKKSTESKEPNFDNMKDVTPKDQEILQVVSE